MSELIPVSWTTYHLVARLCYNPAILPIKGEKIRSWRNVHPEWDCQPWSEGYGHYYGDIVALHGTELSSDYYVDPAFLQAGLWYSFPGVAAWPRK